MKLSEELRKDIIEHLIDINMDITRDDYDHAEFVFRYGFIGFEKMNDKDLFKSLLSYEGHDSIKDYLSNIEQDEEQVQPLIERIIKEQAKTKKRGKL